MGIDAGPPIPDTRGGEHHIEAGDDCLRLWSADEMVMHMRLGFDGAKALLESLELHAKLLGWNLRGDG